MTPLIIVSAPSGGGKSTLCQRAVSEYKEVVYSVSYTTRPIREGETMGSPYYFVSKEEFLKLQKEGFFIESALVHENWYGTSRNTLERLWAQGKVVIMDVDVQGAQTFKGLFPDAVSVFVLPPSVQELKRRVESRDKGTTSNLELRIKNAVGEMAQADDFDHKIVNDVLEKAYSQLKKIIDEMLIRR